MMGYYLEPDIAPLAKLKWCEKNGVMIDQSDESWKKKCIKIIEDPDNPEAVICCMDNKFFYAIGLAYSIKEFEHFTAPGDPRRLDWFTMPKDLAWRLANYKQSKKSDD